MRLFLIPVARGRSLLYCKRLDAPATATATTSTTTTPLSWHDRIQHKTAQKWAEWERAERGWKKHLVQWGDRVTQRVPFEEWSLKSVPPLKRQKQHAQAQAQAQAKQGPVSLLYPGNVVRRGDVLPTLYRMATERQALHRRRVWGSLAASPLTAPIGLVPLVPNIPFFYLIYRAWSHWRALNGSKHLQFLLEQQLLKPASLPALEQFYATNRAVVNGREHAEEGEKKQENGDDGQHTPTDDILLHHGDGKVLADILDAPELIAEVERAIYQIRVLHGEKDPKDTRSESDSESKNTRTEKGRTDTAPR